MIIGFVTFILFLFTFYTLAVDDFVYIRKNITLDKLFDVIFIGAPFVLLFARIAYVAFHPKWTYLNPLVFFIIPYFPGLFAGGGIVGGIIYLGIVTKQQKLPFGHLSDELILSFLPAAGLYYWIVAAQMGLVHNMQGFLYLGMGMLYTIAYILSRMVFSSGKWIDGALTAIGIALHSLFSLLFAMTVIIIAKKLTIYPYDIFYLVLLVGSLIMWLFMTVLHKKGR